jgi:hypothetical protein
MFVKPEFRREGHASVDQAVSLLEMRRQAYDYALCTVEYTNLVQTMALERAGWELLDTFRSSRTEHTVCLYGRRLEK